MVLEKLVPRRLSSGLQYGNPAAAALSNMIVTNITETLYVKCFKHSKCYINANDNYYCVSFTAIQGIIVTNYRQMLATE